MRVRGLPVTHAGPGIQSAGILVEESRHVTVERNVADDTVSSGIGVRSCEEVTIEDDEIVRAAPQGSGSRSASAGGRAARAGEGTVEVGALRLVRLYAVLSQPAPGTTQGYARITRVSGDNPVVACAALTDGGVSGERSGDGARATSDSEPGSGSGPRPAARGA